ncbi:MAG: toxin co-regulated pilus biosynthesis Q family protein [Alphaproteobacteria bacterium]|nr:toxin co-regulated pilus biosynthesis Q family protein [Alphaproteobacteria bacterium]
MRDKSAVWRQSILTGLLVGAFSFPAQAGFDWTPPPAIPALSTTSAPGPLVPAAPSDDVEASELAPVTAMPAAPAADEAMAAPSVQSETNALPSPAFPEDLPPPNVYAEALGFGADIPLALALGQIVPSEFAYSFASNVNPGIKISWDGGKPWNEVLQAALLPHGLKAKIESSIVIVYQMREEDSAQNQDANQMGAAASSDVTVTEPAMDAPLPITGEGTANNYPRRTPPQRAGLHQGDETTDGAGSAPQPPPIDEQAVIIEQPSQDMATADRVASYEPAAPAPTQDIGIVDSPVAGSAPKSLSPQKISYADEGRASHDELIVPRNVGEPDNSYATRERAVLDPFEIRFWQADSQQNLRDVLASWAGNAGVEVIWDSGYEYKLPHAVSMHGTFSEAVTKIFSLYGSTEPRPQGRLHPNLPKGPSVLLVENFP